MVYKNLVDNFFRSSPAASDFGLLCTKTLFELCTTVCYIVLNSNKGIMPMMKSLDKGEDYKVVKGNDLIQKARFNLTVTQQKIIAYIISKIKPNDKELDYYTISVPDFCELCGIDKTYFYTEIREIIDDLDNKTFWVDTEDKLYKFRWFSEVKVLKGTGTIQILLHSEIKKYLIGLSQNYTEYELAYILAMKGKYSVRLYEWFKSYSYQKKKEISIDELRKLLMAENYKDFRNFRRRVLETAIKEINNYTDLEISYEKVSKGRSVKSLIFRIRFKEPLERYLSYSKTIEKINERNNQIKGQLSIFDMDRGKV